MTHFRSRLSTQLRQVNVSSIKYQDKSLEELRPLVDKFIDSYKIQFGEEIDREKLANKLELLRKTKEDQLFNSVFQTLTAKNIHDCALLIHPDFRDTSIKTMDTSIKAKGPNDNSSHLKKSKK